MMYHLPFERGMMQLVKGYGKIKEAYYKIFQGDYEKAIEAFKQAIVIDPGNASYYYKLSVTCARSNKLEQAIEAAEMAHSLDPDESKYILHLQALLSREWCRKAEQKLLDPTQTTYAIALLKQAIRWDPINVKGYLLLGLAYARMEDYPQAIRSIQKLLKLEPGHELGNNLFSKYKKLSRGDTEDDDATD
jgi:tetratricopeptide (TPR) repeat protein